MKFQDKFYDMIDHNKCPSSEKSDEKCILRKSNFHHSEPRYWDSKAKYSQTFANSSIFQSYDRSSPAPSRDTETKLGSAALAPGAASPTDSFIDRMIMSAQQVLYCTVLYYSIQYCTVSCRHSRTSAAPWTSACRVTPASSPSTSTTAKSRPSTSTG